MFHFLFFKCSEAPIISDKKQYNEATLLERIRLRIHILVCGMCNNYSEKNKKLTDLMECSNCSPKTLDQNAKQQLQQNIENELKKLQ